MLHTPQVVEQAGGMLPNLAERQRIAAAFVKGANLDREEVLAICDAIQPLLPDELSPSLSSTRAMQTRRLLTVPSKHWRASDIQLAKLGIERRQTLAKDKSEAAIVELLTWGVKAKGYDTLLAQIGASPEKQDASDTQQAKSGQAQGDTSPKRTKAGTDIKTARKRRTTAPGKSGKKKAATKKKAPAKKKAAAKRKTAGKRKAAAK